MSDLFYNEDLNDAQWEKIKFMFEELKKRGRPPLNSRTVFDVILWIMKSGGRWCDLPIRYGNWNSIYHKYFKVKHDFNAVLYKQRNLIERFFVLLTSFAIHF